MDDGGGLPVRRGVYFNRVADCWMWLLPSNIAGIAISFLGIWLTLALPRVWVAVLTFHRRGNSPAGQHGDHTREAISDPGGYALDRLWDAGLPRNRLPTEVLPRRDTKMALRDAVIALGGASIFLLVIVLATFTSFLSGDSIAIVQSENCGYWSPNPASTIQTEELSWNRQLQLKKTVLDYARDCYAGRGAAIEGCSRFTRRDLPYTVSGNVACPFGGEMCSLGNEDAAISFATPPIPAQYLGLNADKRLEFVRTTVCSPIVRNESFLIARPGVWEFQYSQSTHWSGVTYIYPARDFTATEVTYIMQSVSERMIKFHPIKDLQVSNKSLLTLIFIDVSHVGYLAECFDPIFYAHDHLPHSNNSIIEHDNLWRSYRDRRDLAPRVLACVDDFDMRNAHTDGQWLHSSIAPQSNTSADIKEWTLLYKILEKSTTGDVIFRTDGSALNASSRILYWPRGSVALTPEQWKIESQHFFEASLANVQFEARRIGLGLDSVDPAMIKHDDGDGICDYLFLINAVGYTNVYFVPWLVIFLVSLLIIVVTFPIGPREKRKLVFEYLPDWMLDLVAKCCVLTIKTLSFTISLLGALIISTLRAAQTFIKMMAVGANLFWKECSSSIRPSWEPFQRPVPAWIRISGQGNDSDQATEVNL